MEYVIRNEKLKNSNKIIFNITRMKKFIYLSYWETTMFREKGTQEGLHSHSSTVHPYSATNSIPEIHFVIVNDANYLKRKTKENEFAIQIHDIRL